MTRVNLVPTQELYDQHLMAEYREIPMINASLKRSLNAVNFNPKKLSIPKEYVLGTGHVKFFYNKGEWLYKRYLLCIEELLARNFNVDPESRNIDWEVFKEYNLWLNNWEPSAKDIYLSRQRIAEKVAMKPNWYRKTEYASS